MMKNKSSEFTPYLVSQVHDPLEYYRLDAKNNMRIGVMPRPLTINRIIIKFSTQYSHLAERLKLICICLLIFVSNV